MFPQPKDYLQGAFNEQGQGLGYRVGSVRLVGLIPWSPRKAYEDCNACSDDAMSFHCNMSVVTDPRKRCCGPKIA